MKAGVFRPSRLADLYMAVGQVSGVLAYAALDLGDATSAAMHGAAAWHMANLVENDELRAWARGTQSLIARFNQEYVRAQLFAEEGLRFAGTDESKARLLCAAAQCAANQGDAGRTLGFIRDTQRVRDGHASNGFDGIFGFPLAKQMYYFASSLMWLSDRESLTAAGKYAQEAIELWRQWPQDERIVDDEALAHVYLATIRLKLGEVEGAAEAVAPILEIPLERKTSWMRKRVSDMRKILGEEEAGDARSIISLRHKLTEFEAS
jgi:hypothetical protein